MFGGDICFDSDLTVPELLALLRPLFTAWIGEDHLRHYRADLGWFYYNPGGHRFSISLGNNSSYRKSAFDDDRFRRQLTFLDLDGELGKEQHLARMTQALELFWSHGIPTCTPGWTDELPHGGGEEGPVPWPR